MALRSSTRNQPSSSSSTPALSKPPPPLAHPVASSSPQLRALRQQWKWAAFSQFFYTFSPLFALEDVSLVDIEEDLVSSTMVVLPRLMQRLLITLSNDRKINLVNWQHALRKQYAKRNPEANPIGFESVHSRQSRDTTVDFEVKRETLEQFEGDPLLPSESLAGDTTDNETLPKRIIADESTILDSHPSTPASAHATIDTTADDGLASWADLPMLDKLASIHTVMEWHFQNPLRLRNLMKSDDEYASWRIEPIGYDSKHNAYWMIGPDRLWIQRQPLKARVSKKARTNTRKTILKSEKSREISLKSTTVATSKKRKAEEANNSGSRSKRRLRMLVPETISPQLQNGRARAAKTQANVKLDLQAKQLAAAKAELMSFSRGRAPSSGNSSPKAVGTRSSRRLRGKVDDNDDDDEWQRIPDEWLDDSESNEGFSVTRSNSNRYERPRRSLILRDNNSKERTSSRRTGLESDEESDLTELSDSDHVPERLDADTPMFNADELSEDQDGQQEEQIPPDFVEWETICVSLDEWEHVADQFAKASHYLEKALHRILSRDIVPVVLESLREVERQRMKEEALMNRKRSSRIAIRESEKEAARQAVQKKVEEDEKRSRARRLEARVRKEEEERLRKEEAREKRRIEREERELLRSRRNDGIREASVDPPITRETSTNHRPNKDRGSQTMKTQRRHGPKDKSTKEDWELDCEICGSKGKNRDEDVPLMSCENCSKWQHIPCHDSATARAGLPQHNWDVEEFICRKCRIGFFDSHKNTAARQSTRDVATDNPVIYLNRPGSRNGSFIHQANGAVPVPTRFIDVGGQAGGLPGQANYFPYNHNSQISGSSQVHRSQPGFTADATVLIPATSKKALPVNQPRNSVTFAHYQPHERGFSTYPTYTRALDPVPSRSLPLYPDSARLVYSTAADRNGQNFSVTSPHNDALQTNLDYQSQTTQQQTAPKIHPLPNQHSTLPLTNLSQPPNYHYSSTSFGTQPYYRTSTT